MRLLIAEYMWLTTMLVRTAATLACHLCATNSTTGSRLRNEKKYDSLYEERVDTPMIANPLFATLDCTYDMSLFSLNLKSSDVIFLPVFSLSISKFKLMCIPISSVAVSKIR